MFVLKQLRREKKINQTDLAHAIGVSLRTIQLYEKKNANIPIKNLTKMADFFEVSIAEMYSHEVNEGIHGYELNTRISDGPISFEKINANKWILNVPLVASEKYSTYCDEFEKLDFIMSLPSIGFVVEDNDPQKYVAFEIVGNSMENETAASIPNGAMVLGKEVSLDDLEALGKVDSMKAIIVYGKNILCKEITEFDDENQRIGCHSLNTSPEYADFEIPLPEIKQLFEVIKKQTS